MYLGREGYPQEVRQSHLEGFPTHTEGEPTPGVEEVQEGSRPGLGTVVLGEGPLRPGVVHFCPTWCQTDLEVGTSRVSRPSTLYPNETWSEVLMGSFLTTPTPSLYGSVNPSPTRVKANHGTTVHSCPTGQLTMGPSVSFQ